MIEKDIHFSSDAKSKLKDGVDKLADAVKETLGAAGKTVILEDDFGRPHVTKDGVTVAKSINLSDPVEHLGASILKQASIKTADEAGDGTTTSIVVAQGIIDYAYNINDVNVTSFKNELEFLAELLQRELVLIALSC
jgi:chaperonin GroEL